MMNIFLDFCLLLSQVTFDTIICYDIHTTYHNVFCFTTWRKTSNSYFHTILERKRFLKQKQNLLLEIKQQINIFWNVKWFECRQAWVCNSDSHTTASIWAKYLQEWLKKWKRNTIYISRNKQFGAKGLILYRVTY